MPRPPPTADQWPSFVCFAYFSGPQTRPDTPKLVPQDTPVAYWPDPRPQMVALNGWPIALPRSRTFVRHQLGDRGRATRKVRLFRAAVPAYRRGIRCSPRNGGGNEAIRINPRYHRCSRGRRCRHGERGYELRGAGREHQSKGRCVRTGGPVRRCLVDQPEPVERVGDQLRVDRPVAGAGQRLEVAVG